MIDSERQQDYYKDIDKDRKKGRQTHIHRQETNTKDERLEEREDERLKERKREKSHNPAMNTEDLKEDIQITAIFQDANSIPHHLHAIRCHTLFLQIMFSTLFIYSHICFLHDSTAKVKGFLKGMLKS